jgi:hypothetical protein
MWSSSIGSSDCIEHVFIPRVHDSNHYGGKNTTRGVVIKLVTSSGASASVWLVAGLLQNGFWVFVDMASGRYLWRNLRQTNKDVELKSS